MESYAGIPTLEWLLAQLYVFALALVVGSVFWRSEGSRLRGVLVVPFVVGVAGVAILYALFPTETRGFLEGLGERRASFGVAAALLVVGIAVPDLLVARVAALLRSARALGAGPLGSDAALAVALLVPGALALATMLHLDRRTVLGGDGASMAGRGVRVVAEYELPAQPLDLELDGQNAGYLSAGDGRIYRFVLPERAGDPLDLSVAATGLESPRGLALMDDVLVVGELGPLPCDAPFPCKGENVDATSREEGELRILRESNGRLLRFEVGSDGSLGRRRVIRARLPVANSDHGVNAVTAGPDGRVYVSVGNLDRLVRLSPAELSPASSDLELLGVVFSIRPDGGDLDVYARGLRNVYDLVFDDAGRLYGVDNDGATVRGWRREEVLELHRGADYGYPFDGTFAPYTRRTTPPLWVLETAGSAGVEWTRRHGRPTLVVGSCSDVYALTLAEARGSVTVPERDAVQHVLTVPGCVTAVKRLPRDRYLMALFGFGGPPRLYVVELGR